MTNYSALIQIYGSLVRVARKDFVHDEARIGTLLVQTLKNADRVWRSILVQKETSLTTNFVMT